MHQVIGDDANGDSASDHRPRLPGFREYSFRPFQRSDTLVLGCLCIIRPSMDNRLDAWRNDSHYLGADVERIFVGCLGLDHLS